LKHSFNFFYLALEVLVHMNAVCYQIAGVEYRGMVCLPKSGLNLRWSHARKKGTGFETKKSKATKEKIRIHCKAFGGTLDDMECMKLTGLARNTYYKYKRQIREDAEMKD
jgi:hydrogenase maturation factor